MGDGSGQARQTKQELIDELGMAVRASQNRSDALDELVARRLGINDTDLRCLDIVQQHGRITAGKLAELAGLTTGAVTAVLDRLEAMAYARRVRDTEDRRRVMVELTDKAFDATWDVYGPLKERWDAALARYTSDQLRLMLEILNAGEEIGRAELDRLRALEDQHGPGFRAGGSGAR